MHNPNKRVIDVLLTTEGTYPVTRGGVSTWCDILLRGAPGVRYHLYAVVAHPYLPDRYALPAGLKVDRVPLWGTEEPTEHLDLPFSTLLERKRETTLPILRHEFLPLFDRLQESIWSPYPDGRRTGEVLFDLYRWFQRYDYREAMKSPHVWDFYTTGLRNGRWTHQALLPTVQDAIQSIGWLYRFLVILNTPVPAADITHASAAAFAGLAGVLAKMDRKTPYLLSEHGVYLREQYLSIGRSNMSLFAKQFLMGLVRSIATVNYAYADIVAPVAAFNARWEKHYGVPEEKIRVIYNGVDPAAFTPRPRPAGAPPTVVSVARIDPLKDHLNLLRAAALVRQQIPAVKFAVYGGVAVPEYYQQCLALREELGLTDCFVFAGNVTDTAAAYASGDVVVLSSISEGFPYSVVEAMMSGRAVVATDVGGVREAVTGAGLLVEPRNPEQLAGSIRQLLNDPLLRNTLAEEGRERALTYFTIHQNLRLYRAAYDDLLGTRGPAAALSLPSLLERRRRLALDRARALQMAGQTHPAIAEYRMAVDLEPEHPATPGILLTIAELYLSRGQIHQSWHEVERAEALASVIRSKRAG